ncbi:ribosome maturation factor RimP [Halopseudomonas phragmitis]|uniref:Ribosome maturation factor RimP n=2 Tax=Pseudomonadaceae TaxID=135621 RepID=A0A1V0B9W9_9GAMM|nr:MULTISPECIES: ribosome maturation factor RimP [Pseudomonadaceae]AQZ96681.1 ribosome maturation factor RimP [Halopseudomonas phragmitis]RHW20335.1 ribosome maturation factor RimP [Pseudomonas jilinensis]
MSGKQTELEAMLAPSIEALGYQCWGIEYLSQGKHTLLRVYIEHADGIDVEACATVSRQLSAVLDVEDPIANDYTLEVSSPGMDRPLFKLEQYAAYVGEQAKIRLRTPFDGRRNFQGILRGVEGDEVVIQVDDHEYLLPIDSIDKGNIIPRF